MPQADELLTRAAAVQPSTFNPADRTVRVTWSTGAAVNRRDAHGPYSEVLSLDPAHVRMAHLQGAPVLDAHQRHAGVRNVLGVVRQAGLEPGAGWADLQFSSRAEVQPIMQDVQDGVIRHVSVGYAVHRWADSADPTTGARTRTAVDWSPREISFVPLPADAGATVRGSGMDTTTDTTTTTNNDPPADTGNRATVNTQIRSIATAAGLDTTFADGLIDRAATVEQARAAAFDELIRRGGGAIQTARVEVGQANDDPAVMVTRMADALSCRMTNGTPSDAARPFMSLSLQDMARNLLAARGERVGMLARDELLTRAMTTSDFPNLLTATGNRVLMNAYQAAPNPLKTLARQSTVPDFRPKSLLKLGAMSNLQKVSESGEVKNTSRAEEKEGYSLDTYGSIFSLSRKALINDDLGAFNDWSVAMGRAAAETEASLLVTLLTQASGAGPTMDDGKALFHTGHGNVASSGAAPSVTTLGAARAALRKMTGVGGEPINATPKFLLVSPDLETSADQLVASLFPATVDNANPWPGRITPMVEPRISGNGWYVFADPALLPCLEYSYLSSAAGPQIASREGWSTLGMEFRVTLDFGCGAIDWRGAYRNPGA